MPARFDQQTAIVIGAGSGIGAATARRLSADGANVVLAGRTRAKLDAVAKELPAEHTLVQVCDVADAGAVQALVDAAVQRLGGLHMLVSNAGIGPEGSVPDTDASQWSEVMGINAGGVFHGAKAALPHLLKTQGCIVNTASVSGLGGDWALAAYNASKGAIVNLTRAMALDHAKDGVRVNAVCPSLVRTPMTESMFQDEQQVAEFLKRIPLGRWAEPEDVADVIALLCSHDARFVTGVCLPVDGGVTASNGQPRMG